MSTSAASARRSRRLRFAAVPAIGAVLTLASTALAHDFWVIPDMFAFSGDSTLHFSGRAGTRFPTGTAVQPERIADARLVGASSQTKIAQMSVEGGSLRLHQKAPVAGQYTVVLTLSSTPTRSTGAGLLRFLKGEGGASEAARLESEKAVVEQDSLVFHATSYAEAVIEVGRGGPKAFSVSAGIPLEFIPINDPSHLHMGDTLHVKVVGHGKAVPNIGIFSGAGVDTSAAAKAAGPLPNTSVTLTADANGVAHIPLTTSGPWNLRAAHVSKAPAGAPAAWTIARTTYVFGVSPKH
jgi:uncharacterized GH25 family protein